MKHIPRINKIRSSKVLKKKKSKYGLSHGDLRVETNHKLSIWQDFFWVKWSTSSIGNRSLPCPKRLVAHWLTLHVWFKLIVNCFRWERSLPCPKHLMSWLLYCSLKKKKINFTQIGLLNLIIIGSQSHNSWS